MFRDEMEAALARAEAAERELAELEAKDDASQAQIEALQQEVERLRRSGGREVTTRPAPRAPAAPSAAEGRAWRVAQVAGALYVAVALVYLGTMVWLIVGSAVPAAPWGWLRSEGLSDGPLGAFAGWGLGLGLLAFFLCVPVVMAFHAYFEKRPDIEMDTSNLIVLLIVTGPLWVIAAVVYAVRLFRHGSRARWLAIVLLVAALCVTVLAGTFWLFALGDST
jgi:hypothetical protein